MNTTTLPIESTEEKPIKKMGVIGGVRLSLLNQLISKEIFVVNRTGVAKGIVEDVRVDGTTKKGFTVMVKVKGRKTWAKAGQVCFDETQAKEKYFELAMLPVKTKKKAK